MKKTVFNHPALAEYRIEQLLKTQKCLVLVVRELLDVLELPADRQHDPVRRGAVVLANSALRKAQE